MRKRLVSVCAVAAAAAATLLVAAPAQAASSTVRRTCSANIGVPWASINFDVDVTFDTSTHRVSTVQPHSSAYLSGLYIGQVDETYAPFVALSSDRHGVQFNGDARISATIPGTTINYGAQEFGCAAFWTF